MEARARCRASSHHFGLASVFALVKGIVGFRQEHERGESSSGSAYLASLHGAALHTLLLTHAGMN